MANTEETHPLLAAIELSEASCLDLDLVRVLAGEQRPSDGQRARLVAVRGELGDDFYVAVLLCLTNHCYEPAPAEFHWRRMLLHRDSLEQQLGRKVGISVAALDYLTNVAGGQPDFVNVPEETFENITERATRDGMTGLFDHATFQVLYEHECQKHTRYGKPLSVLMIDIDDFKGINDRFGHDAGDGVIRTIAEIIETSVRAADVAARYGGEEFAVVLPQANAGQAGELAERIRSRIEREIDKPVPVTVSIGHASTDGPSAANCPDLIRQADAALYRAKEAGKNRVLAAG